MKALEDQGCLARAWVTWFMMAMSELCSQMVEGQCSPLGGPFIRVLTSFKGPPDSTLILMIRFLHINLGRDRNIQTTAKLYIQSHPC
jgi:hypothetical protein